MRLQKVVLFNRAPFENLHLVLDKENIIVCTGLNGTGKTTFLSYIVDSFYELAKNGFENEFENAKDKYYRVTSSLNVLKKELPSIVYLKYEHKSPTPP